MGSLEEVIERMREIAPAGLDSLNEPTRRQLILLTDDLAALCPGARSEYERFSATRARGTGLDSEAFDTIRGRRILVTGGTGCIGSALLGLLAGLEPGRLVSVSRGVTPIFRRIDGVRYERCDVRDGEAIDAVFSRVEPELVFHLAAIRDPASAESSPVEAVRTNVLGAANVIEASVQYSVETLTYASTGKAVRYYTRDIYAATKKLGEWLLACASPMLPTAAARFTHVVDNSLIDAKLRMAARGSHFGLHDPYLAMYGQSALESAQLLALGCVMARQHSVTLVALRDLGEHYWLTDLVLGLRSRLGVDTPLYFTGFAPGYEQHYYAGLYDPKTVGDSGPLLNAVEATRAEPGDPSPANVVTVPAAPAIQSVADLLDGARDTVEVARLLESLDVALLDTSASRLATAPPDVLARVAEQASRGEALSIDHQVTDRLLALVRGVGRRAVGLRAAGL